MKKALCLVLAVFMLLTGCSSDRGGEPDDETEVAITTIKPIEDLPNISFLVIFNSSCDEVMNGLFIDDKGSIKEFSFENKVLNPPNGEFYYRSSNIYNKKDINFIGKLIINNYDNIIASAKDTGISIDINELMKYYYILMEINIDSEMLIGYDYENDEKGFASYYGIRTTPEGTLETILFKCRGDINYENTNPYIDFICDWLIELLPCSLPFTNSNEMFSKDFFEKHSYETELYIAK